MKRTTFDRNFDYLSAGLLVLLLLVVLYPLYFVIIASVSDPSLVSMGNVTLYPRGFTLEGYKKVIEYEKIWTGYRNTLMYVVGYTFVSVSATMMAGYALSRKQLVGKGPIMFLITFTMFFSGGMIPSFLLVNSLGLVDKPIIIVIMGSISAYNVIISRTFMQSSIPEELYEASSIDGCGYSRFFFHVVLPLSPALLAVLMLFAAVGQWNSWFNAMIYLRSPTKMPLQIVLREIIVSESQMASNMETGAMMGEDAAQQALLVESMKYAVIIVSSLPILCLYPFVQKHFVKGVMIGSIKG